jgi:hypothetical protein
MKSPSPPDGLRLSRSVLSLLAQTPNYKVNMSGGDVVIVYTTSVKGGERIVEIKGKIEGDYVLLNSAKIVNPEEGTVRDMPIDELGLWVEYLNGVVG